MRQSVLLITVMLFDYLIAIVTQKAAEIGMVEVPTKIAQRDVNIPLNSGSVY